MDKYHLEGELGRRYDMLKNESNQYFIQYDKLLMKLYDKESRELRTPYKKVEKIVNLVKECIKHKNLSAIISKITVNKQLKKVSKFSNPTVVEIIKEDDILLNDRIAVYTAVFGNYDNIYQPWILPDNCDFYIITDQQKDYGIFKQVEYDKSLVDGFCNAKKNRYFKLHPEKVFPQYRYTIYIDGSIEIKADLTPLINKVNKYGVGFYAHGARNCIFSELEACKILKKGNYKLLKEQCNSYEREGFPKEFGMIEAGVIAREHNIKECLNIMEAWWKEYCKWESRDQISLPYVLWRNGMSIQEVATLGNNIHSEQRFYIHEHR